ncbi:MAG: DUF1464 family protein [Candidatus Altiarchaeota archaeon]
MVRTLGIDPGTKSMDLCGLENGKVFYEKSIPTEKVAKNPSLIIDATKDAFPLDLIAGPSGYGVELTHIEKIPIEKFEGWYYNYILLTTKEEIENAIKKSIFGAMVYYAMTQSAIVMKKEKWPVVYIPGVINLPTVPEYRKINKMDMGTADKMCVAVLATYKQAKRLSIPYEEVSFILVEMGFGYNAVLGVENGRIVDGIGGTTFPGIGFLTASALDFELVQIVKNWCKEDLFSGGVASITGTLNEEEFVKNVNEDEKSKLAWNALFDGIEKAVLSMLASVKKPREILFSGRLTRLKDVRSELKKRLSKYADVREVGFLENSKKTKETAQGYGIVADGLANGKFSKLIEWMKIKEAKGTCIDYIKHPKFSDVRKKFVPFRF